MLRPDAGAGPVQRQTGPGGKGKAEAGAVGPGGTRAAGAKAPAAGGDGSIASQMPGEVELKSAKLSFTIPGRRTFAETWQYAAETLYPTTVHLEATPTGLSIYCSPGLHFDLTWPAQNMQMSSAGVDFRSGQPYARFYTERGAGSGFIDFTARGEQTVTAMIARAIAGTPMARPGYNPLQDRNLLGTLGRLKANFDAMPAAPGAKPGAVGAGDVSAPTLGASLGMKSPFLKAGGDASVSIPGGGVLDVTLAGRGNLGAILAAGGDAQATAMAAAITSVAVRSQDITLLSKKGKPLVKLQQLTVQRGGGVTVDRFEALGGLGAGAGAESLIRLVGILLVANDGRPMEAQRALENGGAEPRIVNGLTKSMLEQGLTDAVRALFRENRNAIPGLDLATVFGVK
jgi:hypothetical protein